MNEIEHIKCAICKENITYKEDDEILSTAHFDISRSKKEYEIISNSVEEIEEEKNEKMRYSICKKCFDTILNESKTLGALFFNKEKGIYLY